MIDLGNNDLGCVSSASLGLLSLKVVVEKVSLSMAIRRGLGGPNRSSNFSECESYDNLDRQAG
jgi:hypothetical protein